MVNMRFMHMLYIKKKHACLDNVHEKKAKKKEKEKKVFFFRYISITTIENKINNAMYNTI